MKKWIIAIGLIGFCFGVFAANLDITTLTIRKIPSFSRRVTLSAGQSLTDVEGLTGYAQQTVPAGYEAKVRIDIHGYLVEAE